MQDCYAKLKNINAKLAKECDKLTFNKNITVYNPLDYAIKPHNLYLKMAASSPKKVIFLGMNPGPWGMAQTGVPFGEIEAVRDWLGIEAHVKKPEREHPKRPILGFKCKRSEVSGRRLWGLFKEQFGRAEDFFKEHYVANYCPLVFMEEGGANITPDKLPKKDTELLYKICDYALAETIDLLKPDWLIGIGGFAYKKIRHVEKTGLCKTKFSVTQILHPSPASPKANKGWDREVKKALLELGIWR